VIEVDGVNELTHVQAFQTSSFQAMRATYVYDYEERRLLPVMSAGFPGYLLFHASMLAPGRIS